MFADIPSLSARKEQILQVATVLFSQKGYVAASMRDLAELLNIKPASLYSHYESKDEILWEIARRCARDFHVAIQPIVAQDLAPYAKLRAMLEAHVAAIIRNMDAAAIFFTQWKRLKEPHHAAYAQSIREYEEAFAKVLEAGMESGDFRTGKAKFITSVLLSGVNWIHQWYRPDGNMSSEEVTEQLTQLLLDGLRDH